MHANRQYFLEHFHFAQGFAATPSNGGKHQQHQGTDVFLVFLEIAPVMVTGAFLIAFGGLVLTLVLAFGLGSRRAVESMWEKRLGGPGADPTRDKTKPDAS